MDALSSQANAAGHRVVLLGAQRLPTLVSVLYMISFSLFIYGLMGLTGPRTAVRGHAVTALGMTVEQTQHAVREMAGMLEANGVEVIYAVHPVVGRMPILTVNASRLVIVLKRSMGPGLPGSRTHSFPTPRQAWCSAMRKPRSARSSRN